MRNEQRLRTRTPESRAFARAGGPAVKGILSTAGESLLAVAEPTTAGLDWRMWPGYASSSPNYSHGTAGVAAALAVAGHPLADLRRRWVGDALLDAYQDLGDAEFYTAAVTMGDALVQRAVVDEAGARWRFVEHRQDPPLLPPGTSWMQGAAGIAAFLFRLARVLETGPAAPVVVRPDQWWAVPAAVRTTQGLPGLG